MRARFDSTVLGLMNIAAAMLRLVIPDVASSATRRSDALRTLGRSPARTRPNGVQSAHTHRRHGESPDRIGTRKLQPQARAVVVAGADRGEHTDPSDESTCHERDD